MKYPRTDGIRPFADALCKKILRAQAARPYAFDSLTAKVSERCRLPSQGPGMRAGSVTALSSNIRLNPQ